MTRRITTAALAASLLTAPVVFGADKEKIPSNKNESHIQREVRHELATLGLYTIFDNLAYKVDGTQVTLIGQVTNPVLKDDAQKAVKSIEGVTAVNNEIEVLPVSPMDWQIRRAVARTIYADPDLSRYSLQAIPSIHVIVKNGNVTLEGAVATEMDKSVANIRANSVSGVFHVTNNLHVDSDL